MQLFRRAKDEDAVDHVNKVWTVFIFLLLALVTWLVLLTSGQGLGESSRPKKVVQPQSTQDEFKANCWTPSQFTSSHVNYVNSYCGKAFNDAIYNRTGPRAIYKMIQSAIPIAPNSRDVVDIVSDIFKDLSSDGDDDGTQEDDMGKDKSTDNAFKFPIAFVLIAILIRLPYFLYKLLCGCVGLLNIDRLLSTAVKAQSDRQSVMESLARAASAEVKRKPWASSVLYLLVKFLCCLILVVSLVGVQTIMVNEERETKPTQETISVTKDNPLRENPVLCDFEIRMLQNVQHYTVQCTISRIPSLVIGTGSDGVPPTDAGNGFAVLKSFEVLSCVVLVYLIVLLVANVLSLLTWSCRLALSQCQSGPVRDVTEAHAPLDLRLLLLFSQDNANPLVTEELAQCFSNSPTVTAKATESSEPDAPAPDVEKQLLEHAENVV